MRVAVVGTGSMGGAVARTLAENGLPLTLWNRSRQRAADLAQELGAALVDTPAQAAAGADVLITMLADGPAVEQVYLGPDGIVSGAGPGLIACEMSTVQPDLSRRLAGVLRPRGADLIDAPVSGSVSVARAGALTVMVGGDPDTLERARPVLQALGSNVFWLGDVGSGAVMKLSVNSLVHGLNQALAEALVLAERAGVDTATAYTVFESGAAGAPFVKYKREAYLDPDHAPVAFRLALARKDARLILDLARAHGVVMEQTEANLRVLEAAMDRYADADMAAVARHLRDIAGPAEEATEPARPEKPARTDPATPDVTEDAQ